ncbi:acyl carrier protein [Paenibacillus sp. TSA_86.1]|uniref:acyl carrier protein n=1 Tax=Paenibacillus sp. TSA_86.1 TaxID=3415649 RepID=UPI00404605F5
MSVADVGLEEKIKKLIVSQLGLDISHDSIDEEAPLFDIDDNGSGLDLDSVDALELAVGIKRDFQIVIQNTDLASCYNVKSIAQLIRSYSGEEK